MLFYSLNIVLMFVNKQQRERVGGMQTEKEEQSSTVVACKSCKRYITWSGTDFIQSQSGDVCTHPCVR